jgi:mannose-6-phosphate isomerase
MKIVEKPWGRELWIAHTDRYALKIIEFKKGSRSSLQYHVKKHEHIYVDSGALMVELENEQGEIETVTLNPGDIIENQPGRKHRVTALEDVRLIEVSTPELDDVVRVEDDYRRTGSNSNG